MDDLTEAFMDRDLEYFGSSSVRLTQSGEEKRSRLLANRQNLIEAATKAFNRRTADFNDVMFMVQPVMTSIASNEVNEDGHIKEGSIGWTCQVSSPISKRVARIEMTFPIIMGKIKNPKTFKTSSGKVYMFNKESIKKAIGTSFDDVASGQVRRLQRSKVNISARPEI